MIKIEDTKDLMCSDDYKERFRAEYIQLYIRAEKLGRMLNNWSNLDFKPKCTKTLLQSQYKVMTEYLKILRERSIKEQIPLPHVSEFY